MPKFLLPVNSGGKSLLKNHIELAENYYDKILIATKEEFTPLLNPELLGNKVEIVSMSTGTMSETVLELTKISNSSHFGLVMPDTFFLGASPHAFLALQPMDLKIAAWRIRKEQKGKLGQVEISDGAVTRVIDKDVNCSLEHAWGALSFSRDFLNYIKPDMPHIGYGIPEWLLSHSNNSCEVIDGEYYDCGTPREYFDLIKRTYISN